MNDTSSRSHAYIDLKMYRIDGDNLHTNFIKFMDLAGSERLEKAGTDKEATAAKWEGIFTNMSLTFMAMVMRDLGNMKKPLTGGEPIPKNT